MAKQGGQSELLSNLSRCNHSRRPRRCQSDNSTGTSPSREIVTNHVRPGLVTCQQAIRRVDRTGSSILAGGWQAAA